MVGWHHQLNGHEFEQNPEDGEGRGTLECCSPWGHNEQLNSNLFLASSPRAVRASPLTSFPK